MMKSLFKYCDGKIELRALPSRKREFFEIDDKSGLGSFCSRNAGENLFFGVATRDGQRGAKENIFHIPAAWCDCDFKDTQREILADRLKAFPFKPSLMVKSGGGVHLYWILKEPGTKDDILKVEDVNRRIASVLGGDLKACDAAHILRIPGTANHKYENKPLCEVVEQNNFEYELDDFLSVLPEYHKSERDNTGSKNTADWLQEAMKGVSDGSRNATATKIAGYFINKLPAGDVIPILRAWNQNNDPPLPDRELETVVKSVGRYEPEKAPKKVDIGNVYTAERMLAEYRDYVRTLKENRFITGIHEIDKRIRGVAGGEVLTIIARAGSFKTAILQNLLKGYVQNSSWGAVFFSIEMPVASVTERYHEILGGMTGREIEEFYSTELNGAEEHRKSLEADFIKELKNLYVIPTRVAIPDISRYVQLIEEHHSVKIGVIGIDYLGLIDGPGINEYEIISRLSRDIKTMAKMLNLPVILLSQVSRKGGSGEVEIFLDMGRGSGAIEEAADFVLGLFQVENENRSFLQENKHDLICKILKNRKGSKGSRWRLDLDPANLRIGPEAEPWEPSVKKKDVF